MTPFDVRSTWRVFPIAALAGSFGLPAPASERCETVKLYAPHPEPGQSFGSNLAIEGRYMVIGANDDDPESAHVFEYDFALESWRHIQTLIAPDGGPNNSFGEAVALGGDVIVVGAPFHDHEGIDDSGAVYVYRRVSGTWVFEQELRPGGAGGEFGRGKIAIDGCAIIAGSHFDDENGSASGSAYVFRFDPGTKQWDEEAKLTASDGSSGDQFGYAVDILDDVAVVGAFGDGPGSAYVFQRCEKGWVEEEKLTASDGSDGDFFGWSLAIDHRVIVIGAWQDESAYVFRFDPGTKQWDEEAKLLASDGAAGDIFGDFVSITASRIVVGAHHDDIAGVDTGSAYVFEYDCFTGTWTQADKLAATDGEADDLFGAHIGLCGDIVMVSARRDDDQGFHAGAVYMFDLSKGNWTTLLELLSNWRTCP